MLKGKPFVKWAGGKRQILDKLKKYVPNEFNTYYEPFIGGGALLFELSPKKAVINDSNQELMNVYNCLCNEEKFKKMCNVLNHYEREHSEKFYYEIRNKDRDKKKYNRLSDYTKAARTIYLNKACFNGLYRVNSKNEFNVPFGKKEKVNTYDGGNLITVSNYLTMNDIKILSIDFEESVKDAKKGDFVYFDPPYDSDTKTFNSYTDHNTLLVNKLYQDYYIHHIEAKRNINSKGSKRGKVEEVIITNFINKVGFDSQDE